MGEAPSGEDVSLFCAGPASKQTECPFLEELSVPYGSTYRIRGDWRLLMLARKTQVPSEVRYVDP